MREFAAAVTLSPPSVAIRATCRVRYRASHSLATVQYTSRKTSLPAGRDDDAAHAPSASPITITRRVRRIPDPGAMTVPRRNVEPATTWDAGGRAKSRRRRPSEAPTPRRTWGPAERSEALCRADALA